MGLDPLQPNMEIRGERECSACGNRWSYYDTGRITCPACGSVRSVGVDEPSEHTAGTATFDLTSVRADVDEAPLADLADRAAEEARAHVRNAGFVHAGELQPLDDTFLAATELRRVGTTLGRVMHRGEAEELYFLELLGGADRGERPDPDAVPEPLYPERGLAVAASVDVYLSDLRRAYGDRDSAVNSVLSTARAHRKRIEALDGDVDPAAAERLVRTVRDLSAFLREDDEPALARARERLA